MNAAARCGVLVALLALSTACSEVARVTAPAPTPQVTPTPPTPPRPVPVPYTGVFPEVTRPARIYVATPSPLFSITYAYTLSSRYVLYDDGTFAFQLFTANDSFYETGGTYTEADALITLVWPLGSGWDSATASLSDESLTVRYTHAMHMTDFEDCLYMRSR